MRCLAMPDGELCAVSYPRGPRVAVLCLLTVPVAAAGAAAGLVRSTYFSSTIKYSATCATVQTWQQHWISSHLRGWRALRLRCTRRASSAPHSAPPPCVVRPCLLALPCPARLPAYWTIMPREWHPHAAPSPLLCGMLRCCALQAVFVAHRARAAMLPATAAGPGRLTVQLFNHTPSVMHIRQLKSSAIGVCVCLCMLCVYLWGTHYPWKHHIHALTVVLRVWGTRYPWKHHIL